MSGPLSAVWHRTANWFRFLSDRSVAPTHGPDGDVPLPRPGVDHVSPWL
jgi:hypothetical protein